MNESELTDVQSRILDVEKARSDVLACVSSLDDASLCRRPAVGAWSVAEIIEHLVLAEDFGLRGLWREIDRLDDDAPAAALDPAEAARTIDQIFLSLDLPNRVDAPEAVIPAAEGRPPRYWIARLRTNAQMLAALGATLEPVGAERVLLPHFVAGDLDGLQRLQFFRWHFERHLGQIERTIEGLEGGS
jgi:hypothetical protein